MACQRTTITETLVAVRKFTQVRSFPAVRPYVYCEGRALKMKVILDFNSVNCGNGYALCPNLNEALATTRYHARKWPTIKYNFS